jgi:hypothetical protein
MTVAVSLVAVAACSDSTAPSSAKSAPTRATSTRYILASGETPPGDCRDLGNGLWLCDDGNQLQPQARTTAPKPEDDNSGN